MTLDAILYAGIAGASTLAGISVVQWKRDLAIVQQGQEIVEFSPDEEE